MFVSNKVRFVLRKPSKKECFFAKGVVHPLLSQYIILMLGLTASVLAGGAAGFPLLLPVWHLPLAGGRAILAD